MLPADDFTGSLGRGLNDFIIQTLVGAFSVVMLDIFVDQALQVTFSKDEHSVQAFAFYTPDKSLTYGIEVGRHRQGADGLGPSIPENLSERLGEEGAPVMDDILFTLQKAGEGVCQVPGHLLHPGSVGLLTDADYLHFPGCIINANENIIPG